MATTLATLRASLKRKTDSQLTVAADQDIYLALGEKYVLRNWIKFDPGRFREARDSATTDSSGILLLDADTTSIERIEDSNKVKYNLIDDINDRWSATGYYTSGFDQTNEKVQLQIMKNGAVLASTKLFFYDTGSYAMATSTSTSQTILPEEYRDVIAKAGAYHYFQDSGPQFTQTANYWKRETLDDLVDARKHYKNFSKDPSYMPSNVEDAGGATAWKHVVS